MSRILYCGALIFLAVLSPEDIRRKEISVKKVMAGALLALICRFLTGQFSWLEMAGSLIPGICLLFLSVAAKGSIGNGDGIVVMGLGLWMGGFYTCLIVCLAVWMTGIAAVVCLIRKQREPISFVPFLLLGMEVLLLYA